MKKRLSVFVMIVPIITLLLIPLLALAGGEGLDVPEALENTVNLEGLSGISYYFAWSYNNNLLLYAISCTLTMAIVGIIIAFVTDFILKAMGLEVNKIEHHE